MNNNKSRKQRMIGRGLDQHNTIRSRMSDKRWIRPRDSKVIQRTRPLDTLDQFVTQRTYHRITIRYQVLKILRDGWEMQGILHNK
jgi:hypothetical protein